jgi:hypothetical protein
MLVEFASVVNAVRCAAEVRLPESGSVVELFLRLPIKHPGRATVALRKVLKRNRICLALFRLSRPWRF